MSGFLIFNRISYICIPKNLTDSPLLSFPTLLSFSLIHFLNIQCKFISTQVIAQMF